MTHAYDKLQDEWLAMTCAATDEKEQALFTIIEGLVYGYLMNHLDQDTSDFPDEEDIQDHLIEQLNANYMHIQR
jgi:hypothetical protein